MHVLSTAINAPIRWPIGLFAVSNILPSVAMKFKYTLFNSIQYVSFSLGRDSCDSGSNSGSDSDTDSDSDSYSG